MKTLSALILGLFLMELPAYASSERWNIHCQPAETQGYTAVVDGYITYFSQPFPGHSHKKYAVDGDGTFTLLRDGVPIFKDDYKLSESYPMHMTLYRPSPDRRVIEVDISFAADSGDYTSKGDTIRFTTHCESSMDVPACHEVCRGARAPQCKTVCP